MDPVKYDYIITGMGCAGLTLAVHLIHSKKFSGKKILLIDKDEKKSNDRTWCFWEREQGVFESIVFRRWDATWIHGEDFSKLIDLSPYQYKLIRGIDFYEYCRKLIAQQENFKILQSGIDAIHSTQQETWVECDGQKIYAEYIFNSIVFEKPSLKKDKHWFLQHFKGWIIETPTPGFKPAEATLMDFRVSQKQGTSFIYIMPFSESRALVEYTLFTEQILTVEQYDEALRTYINKFITADNYTVTEEEMGVIPMTNYRFPAVNGNIINIGTAGGQTKASTGYTFKFIQKHAARLTASLIRKNNPFIPLPAGSARYRFYDSVLLNVLKQQNPPGHKIFSTMFRKNKPVQVLRFLDNESSYVDDLKIISSLPGLPFLKAAIRQF